MADNTKSPFVKFRTMDISDLRRPGAKTYKLTQNAKDFNYGDSDKSLGNTLLKAPLGCGMTSSLAYAVSHAAAEGKDIVVYDPKAATGEDTKS